MPNPKRKHTRSRRDSRRSANWRLESVPLSRCSNPQCGRLCRPHAVCPECGFYKGSLVIAPKVKKKDDTGETGNTSQGK